MTTVRARRVLDAVPALDSPRSRLLLVLGDDQLVTGHRASHWTGVAPAIELDLAMATLAQDGLNHADLWYQLIAGDDLVGDDPGVREVVDAIGLGRAADQYHHAILCERPPRDIAFSLARHVVTDHFEDARMRVLTGSSDRAIASLAGKIAWELRYHLEHAAHWIARLGGADQPHRDRFATAMALVLAEAQGFFEPFEGEQEVVASGVLPADHRGIRREWRAALGPLLAPLGLEEALATDRTPDDASGGRVGRHSPDFTDDAWPEMTALYRQHAGATW